MPRLELPPPEKIPRLELQNCLPGDISLGNLYGSAYLIQHTIGKVTDLIVLYMITKSGAIRTHNLSLPVTSYGVKITSSDNLLHCHCIESKISVSFDIFASSVTNVTGVVLDSPMCGASMLAKQVVVDDFGYDSSEGVKPDPFARAIQTDEPYSSVWTILQPSYFWDPNNKTFWKVRVYLEAVANSMHDAKRLIPFLARRGQSVQSANGSMIPSTGSSPCVSGPSGNHFQTPKQCSYGSKKNSASCNMESSYPFGEGSDDDGLEAKRLMIEKVFNYIVEKVGLSWLQAAFDATIAPYANEHR